MTSIAIVTALIILNGLFVASEFAIVGARRPAIERLARRGNRFARVVRTVLSSARAQDRYIAAAQVGITGASLALGMYGEHHLAEWLATRLEPLGELRWVSAHAVASALAIGVLTYLHVVLGEMVPKSLALQFPTPAALAVAAPMRIVELILYPVVVVLNGIGNAVLRLLGIRRTTGGADRYRTADELALIVAESGKEGAVGREPSRVIQELLEFGQLTAGEVMVPRTRMATLRLGAGLEEVAELLRAEPHTRYPVIQDDADHVLGCVHVKDLLRTLPQRAEVGLDLVREIPFLPATAPLDRVLAELRSARRQMAVVMDEHGGTAGIVTLEDLFEEVVGELGDSPRGEPVQWDSAGTLRAAGTARLDELGAALGLDLEREDVDTVSGLVIGTLGRPARVGDVVEVDGLVLAVTVVHGRGVEEVRVVRAPEPQEDRTAEEG